MTDIKLRPDCELAQAILKADWHDYQCLCVEPKLGGGFKDCSCGGDQNIDHLLEVIRGIALAGMERADAFESFTLSEERAGEIANEIMGAVSDD